MFGHVTKLLTAYHHNELTPEERRRVDTHISTCSRCRSEIETTQHIVKTVRSSLMPSAIRSEAGASVAVQRRPLRFVLTTAALLFALGIGLYSWREARLPSWDVARSDGEVTRLRIGHWFQTGSSEAIVRINNVGEIRVEPNSRLQLVQSKPEEYRMHLEHGTLHAKVWAPPRLFFVDTPSATAIDLGCAYDLTVDETGASVLTVTSGLVQLESAGRESIVPAGWSAKTRRSAGPGTPYLNETSVAMKQAIDTIDFGDVSDKSAALDQVLGEAQQNDLITLWHLLQRVDAQDRKRVYEKMLTFSAPPERVTLEGMTALNPTMLDRWKSELGMVW